MYNIVKTIKTLKTFLLVLLAFIACEKEIPHYAEMQAYYQESVNLAQTSLDSISRFSNKVDGFVEVHPSAKEDPLYPEIKENIRKARITIQIQIDDTWGDDIHLDFNFGEDAD